MIEQGNTLYLTGGTPAAGPFDLKMEPFPGRLILIEDSTPKKGELFLPTSGRMSADTATVGASGVSEMEVGARCGVLPGHGLYVEDWQNTGWNLRLLGIACPWYESVPCRILEREGSVRLIPTYDWCLIKREKKESAFETPDIAEWRNWQMYGEVVALGPEAGIARNRRGERIKTEQNTREVILGSIVHFHANPNSTIEEEMITFRYGQDPSLVLVRYGRLRLRR